MEEGWVMEGGMEGRGGAGDKVGKSDLKRKGKNLAVR
jgi:hypothetical protein